MTARLATIAAALLLAGVAVAEPVDDPHGRPDRCAACHEAGPSASEPGPPLTSVVACSACHPGRERDMHAVGMTPAKVELPDGWPTEGGAVVCATCHAEPACDSQRPPAPPYLRGGPYSRPADSCWSCHVPPEYRRVDPHHPDTDRDPDDHSCAACHTTLPETGAAPGEAGLRADPQTLCAICHQESMHEGAAVHLGQQPADGVQPGLPLDDAGRIACWTCHEVHGDDLGESAAGERPVALAIVEQVIGAQWIDLLPGSPDWPGRPSAEEHDPLLALPVTDDGLCRACHGAGPREPGRDR